MRLYAIQLSLFLFSLTRALYTCANAKDFDQKNPAFRETLTDAMKLEITDRFPIHKVIFKYSQPIGAGGFGEVREYKVGTESIVIKRVEPKKPNHVAMLAKEIEILKLMCELKVKFVYNKFIECQSKTIARFYGCVEDGSEVYIFQEKMWMDMGSYQAYKNYNSLRGREKANVMLQIISKFKELHEKHIVHGDIKPENLMIKGNDFNDIRIIDFGMSDYKGRASKGGSPYFISPEQQKLGYLGVEGDIYSLAVTFAWMEESTQIFKSTKMDKKCSKPNELPPDDCVEKFREGILASFNEYNETRELLEVMTVAIAKEPFKRYRSMEEFWYAVKYAAQKLPSLSNPRKKKTEGVVGFIKNTLGFRILASDSLHQSSGKLANRILAESGDFGTKMII